MTFGYPSARYLLSQHHTHFGNSAAQSLFADSPELDIILNRSSSQSPLPDEAYINLFDTVPYIFSSPTAVDVFVQHSPTSLVSGQLADDANVSSWTRANSDLFEMRTNSNLNEHQESSSPPARPATAPSRSMLAFFNSENFDALAHRLHVPLSPQPVGMLSREETRNLLVDDTETMLRLGHAVEGEPRMYREAWVGGPSDPEDEERVNEISLPTEGASSRTRSFQLSIDPHLRLPRRQGRSQSNVARASQTTAHRDDDDDDTSFGHNPILSSNLDTLNAFLSHLPPLSPSSAVTDMSPASTLNASSSFSPFRRRPMPSQQPTDQPATSNLRTTGGAFSLLPVVPLSPLRSEPFLWPADGNAFPSTGAYTHHVGSPRSPAASTDTGMPHPGDMTVTDLVCKDPYGAHLHWEDVQAVARAERERHLRHLGRYGDVEQWVVAGGAVATAEWEAKMIR